MATFTGPNIVANGLIMCYDTENIKSYPGSGITFNNIGARGGTGTLFGSPTFNSDGSLNCNGNQMLQHNDFLNANYMTVGIVFMRNGADSGAGEDILFNKENTWEMRTDGDFLRWAVYTNNQVWFWQNTQSLASGVRWYVNLSYDGNFVRIYINGVKVQTYTYPSNGILQQQSTYPKFNSRNGASGTFASVGNHRMYHWSVYDRALSDDEILQNFKALQVRYGL